LNVIIVFQVIVRPATIFGAEDQFLNWIADTTTRLPFFPVVNAGAELRQPVFVSDVAEALLEIIKVRRAVTSYLGFNVFVFMFRIVTFFKGRLLNSLDQQSILTEKSQNLFRMSLCINDQL
jgi:hypothetical protein